MANIPPGVGLCELARTVSTPFAPCIAGRGRDVQPPACGGPERRDLEQRRRLRTAPVDRGRAPVAEGAGSLGRRAAAAVRAAVRAAGAALATSPCAVAQC